MSSIRRPAAPRSRTASGHIQFFTSENLMSLTSVNDLCCTSIATTCCGDNSVNNNKRKTYTRTAKSFFH